MEDRKIYSRRNMSWLKPHKEPEFFQLGPEPPLPLSCILSRTYSDRLYLCGPKELMSNEWVRQPLSEGWEFAREYVPKHRSPVFKTQMGPVEKTISIKLASESWFDGCENADVAFHAWQALSAEWKSTKIPLLSTPSKTGQALLWQSLPAGEFPSLPDDVASLIRANSFPNRLEVFPNELGERFVTEEKLDRCVQYDMRWAFAMFATLDRFPIGEPRKVGYFKPYEPGFHHVAIKIPDTWNHIGLIPRKTSASEWSDLIGGWDFPSTPGLIFETWVAEPELTEALKHGWEIVQHLDGYSFDKGAPLKPWAKRLMEMRAKLQDYDKIEMGHDVGFVSAYSFAAAAVRNILNHTVGSFHVNGYERERFISDADWPVFKREQSAKTGYFPKSQRVEGGHLARVIVPDNSPLSLYMPHWSAYVWSLERAAVARTALLCDPSTIVKIHGDAIYSTVAQPEIEKLDAGRIGRMRRKQS